MTVAVEKAVKERPILFSGPMVRAILEGRKTQTRRVIKPQPESAWMDWVINTNLNGDNRYWVDGEPTMHLNMEKDFSEKGECPFGKPGERLWVRETSLPDFPKEFSYYDWTWAEVPEEYRKPKHVLYKADGKWDDCKMHPSIHMPRWASRITLEVTEVRVERLNRISEQDCMREGVTRPSGYMGGGGPGFLGYRREFEKLWDSINGKTYPWSSNPFVWCISFKRVDPKPTSTR